MSEILSRQPLLYRACRMLNQSVESYDRILICTLAALKDFAEVFPQNWEYILPPFPPKDVRNQSSGWALRQIGLTVQQLNYPKETTDLV